MDSWALLKLYNSWFDPMYAFARPIEELIRNERRSFLMEGKAEDELLGIHRNHRWPMSR